MRQNARRTLAIRLGIAIARLRTARGWSRPDLARRAALDDTYIRLVEHGQDVPTLTVLVELAQVLGTTPADLVREVTEPE